MVRKIVSTNGGLSLGDMFAIGVTKVISERLLMPLVGNQSVLSGGAKLLGAYGLPRMAGGGKFSSIAGAALAVDGVEDIVFSLTSGNIGFGGMGGSGNGEVI